jgi:hypothetical protein
MRAAQVRLFERAKAERQHPLGNKS